MAEQPVIIIRKKKKGGHGGGHHGGAWKVAYADFVTAMMAFFLMMWLLNVTTSDQRQGLAEYFSPTGISLSHGGSGGVMGGTSINSDYGAEISSSHPMGVNDRATATVGSGEDGEEDVPGKSEKSGGGEEEEFEALKKEALSDAAMLGKAMKKEEQKFNFAEESLRQTIAEAPALRDLAKHLIIDRMPEGLRIQIVDRDKFSLFPSGSSTPYLKGRDLLRLVGKVISRLSNHLSVTGHTDSNPFPIGSRRDNWGLSTDRANVSRRELQVGGVQKNRIARVVGLADRDPFVLNNPKDPSNRRISIVLLREVLRGKVIKKSEADNKKEKPITPTKPIVQSEERIMP
ncbi:MAG TPA: chemotaxis protein MotB [Rhodospirillaceae bacterium]|nr:chemotaxis protein MotB [Rhodospirillaceae bacterium]